MRRRRWHDFLSPNDARLRRELYNAIYGFNSPLFRYGIGSRQAIHIIVDGGRATLKGVVDTQADKEQAYIRARGVPGLFAVTNELMVKGESLIRCFSVISAALCVLCVNRISGHI